MSDSAQPRAVPSYPNSFLFGAISGVTVNAFARQYTIEPLAARPFSYLRSGLVFGLIMWHWDYFRRVGMEHILEREEKLRYYQTMAAANSSVRAGEEDEISNLTEYLAGSSVRA